MQLTQMEKKKKREEEKHRKKERKYNNQFSGLTLGEYGISMYAG
jgi:hypothetical protein